ncbi:hypothetical protein OL239_07465 [Arthrobacter sp. ATA002]|uniref:STM3941 family protein n=1 Tax=Arthrobacter sp. ATA002 TaxID=2991715 RepID=UPI0022A77295|nr:STM3941 family protein [Arthrobacter sp. ATA002]WAP52958.1 hypothetical protein OL239_07465 [Arthrobacter sp. ATA002]
MGKSPDVGTEQLLSPLTFRVSWGRVLGMALLAAGFTVIGVFMVVGSPDWGTKIIGLVSVLFFGGGYTVVLWKMARNSTVLTLSADGITPQSGGLIPWEDFEAVGTGRIETGSAGTMVLGIRLKSYEAYLASFTPEQIRTIRAAAVTGKATGSLLRRSAPRAALGRSPRGLAGLNALPQRDLPGMLQWSRVMSGGWDVTISVHLFRGPAQEVVSKIDAYYRAVMELRSSY